MSMLRSKGNQGIGKGVTNLTSIVWDSAYTQPCLRLAERNGALKEFQYTRNGDKCEVAYIQLDPSYSWAGGVDIWSSPMKYIDLNPLVEKINDTALRAFIDDDMIFLIPKNVPEAFRPYVLIHEVVERSWLGVGELMEMDIQHAMRSEGDRVKIDARFNAGKMEYARRYPHMKGCSMELLCVFRRGEEFSKTYAEWLVKLDGDPKNQDTWFNCGIPGFLKSNGRDKKAPLNVIAEFFLTVSNSLGRDSLNEKVRKEQPWILNYLPKK